MSPGERTRPIMEYVQRLEGRVRQYRSQEMRFRGKWFLWGFGSGFVLGALAAFAAGWVR